MIPPLLTQLAMRPGLFAEHAGAYAELALVEAGELGHRWRRSALWWLACVALGAVGMGLAGTACLLAATLPAATMPAVWGLLLVPALPLLAAALCAWRATRVGAGVPFGLLREQLRADARLLQAVDAAS